MPLQNKFTKEQLDRAKELDIPLTTLYRRVRQGWTLEKACSVPTRKRNFTRDDKGNFIKSAPTDETIARVNKRFQISLEDDRKLSELIETSGLSHSQYIEKVILEHLKSA